MIYADHAATTKIDPDAYDAMQALLQEEYGNPSQPYSFARSAKKALKTARESIAGCLHAAPEEIYFTSGGTESDNWAIKSSLSNSAGYAVTSQIEHHAVLRSFEALEKRGHIVRYLPVDHRGVLVSDTLRQAMQPDAKLVSVMLANNEIGTIEPVAELCEIAHQAGALFHTDAVQAVGHIPVDVKALDVDMLSASAHKFGGPKGTGFLYIKSGTAIDAYLNGGAQESGMRAGTENTASIYAMSVALRNSCQRMQQNASHLRQLETILLTQLKQAGVDFLRNGSENGLPGNVSLSIRGAQGEMLLHRLDLMGICVSTGSACDSANTQLSHVLRAISVPEIYAYGTIRISLGPENTEDEVLRIVSAISKVLAVN